MDWIIWLVVIVVIVAIVWWLLNRNSSRGTSGTAATGTTDNGATDKSAPSHVHDAGHEAGHRGALSGGGAAASASAAAVTGMPAAAGFGHAEPEPEPERTATTADAAGSQAQVPDSAASGATGNPLSPAAANDALSAAAPSRGADTAVAGGNAEWETQWSETPPAEPHGTLHTEPGHGGAHGAHAKEDLTPAAGSATAPVHHPEYTEPHAPTLPGAESAAAEAEVVSEGEPKGGTGFDGRAGEGLTAAPSTPVTPQSQETQPSQERAEASLAAAETRQTAMSSAASETAVGHTAEPAVGHTAEPAVGLTAEPAGHLAADQPYGEGSAAPAADGSGPEGFTVKGNASSMIYHEETSPAFEETVAEVWFLSAAHAEAAGFRPPRRSRQ